MSNNLFRFVDIVQKQEIELLLLLYIEFHSFNKSTNSFLLSLSLSFAYHSCTCLETHRGRCWLIFKLWHHVLYFFWSFLSSNYF